MSRKWVTTTGCIRICLGMVSDPVLCEFNSDGKKGDEKQNLAEKNVSGAFLGYVHQLGGKY